MYCRLCDIEYPKSLRFCKWCGGGLVSRETIAVQHCPSCGSKTEREWIFCNECGVDLATLGAQPRDIACPSCSATVRKGWMFCRQCGEQIATERAAKRCESCNAGTRPSWTFCKQCGASLKTVDPLAQQPTDFSTVAGIPALPLEEIEPFSDLKSGELPPLENVIRHESRRNQSGPQPVAQVETDPHQGTHPFTTSRRTGHLNTDSLEQEFKNHTASVAPQPPASHGRLEVSEFLHEPPPQPVGDVTTAMASPVPVPQEPVSEPVAPPQVVTQPAFAPPQVAVPPPVPAAVHPGPDVMSSTQVMSSPAMSVPGFQEAPVVAPPPPAPPMSDPSTGSVAAGAPMFIPPVEPPVMPAPPAPPPVAPVAYPETGTLYASQPLPPTQEPAYTPQPDVVYNTPAQPLLSDSTACRHCAAVSESDGTAAVGPVGQTDRRGARGGRTACAYRDCCCRDVVAVAPGCAERRLTAPVRAPTTQTGPTETPANPSTPVPPAGMVFVPGGTFDLGTNDASADAYSKPAHAVSVKPYFMDVNEVTNEQYKAFVDATGHAVPPKGWDGGTPKPGTEKMPVVYVTWKDASDYAAWAGKRLPTETEWEFAARGTDGRAYPWGSTWDPAKANVGKDSTTGKVMPVGSFASSQSPFGINDLVGNVWEWTANGFSIYPGGDQSLTPYANTKVIRGGAFDNDGKNTAMYRGFFSADSALPKVGFRCAKDVP